MTPYLKFFVSFISLQCGYAQSCLVDLNVNLPPRIIISNFIDEMYPTKYEINNIHHS